MSASDVHNELAGSSGEGGGDERRKRSTGEKQGRLSSGSSQLTTGNFKWREGSERTAARCKQLCCCSL